MYTSNKIIWTKKEIKFITENFNKKTHKELLKHINNTRQVKIQYTAFKYKLYFLGLKRYNKPPKWSDYEIELLLLNYKYIGDKELAEILNRYESKTRIFNKKNVEKKRELLKIKRTPEEIKRIRERNRLNGYFKSIKRRYPENKISIHFINKRGYKMIKRGKDMLFLHRFLYEFKNGPVPEGYKLYFRDGNSFNCVLENIICLPAGGYKFGINKKIKKRKKVTEIDGCNDYLQLINNGFKII